MEEIRPFVQNETDELVAVLLGIASDMGGVPLLKDTYDPKSKEHIEAGTFPKEEDLIEEIDGFAAVLRKYGVNVLRPSLIPGCNQIFTRDIAFVIEDKIVISNMIGDRAEEQEAIRGLIESVDEDKVVRMPKEARAEGGDVMLWNEYIFIGYEKEPDFSAYKTSRTNEAGVAFIQELFPSKKVKAFELNKSDTIARDNALHLDCCFQPIGTDKAILHRQGFKVQEEFDFLISYFGEDNCLLIDKEEMYNMGSNVFSISPSVIVSERGFLRVNEQLRKWGFVVEEIKYNETAKMEGLLRCSTMPLIRKKNE